MNIQKLKIRKTPHDHRNHAMSYFGAVRIPNDLEGNPRFQCLCCNQVWTHQKTSRLPQGYWLCPNNCNNIFNADPEYNDPNAVLLTMMGYAKLFTREADFWELFYGTDENLFNPDPDWFEWEGELGNREQFLELMDEAQVKPGVYGSVLAVNAMRHCLARLDYHFKKVAQPIDHEAILAKGVSFTDGPTLNQ